MQYHIVLQKQAKSRNDAGYSVLAMNNVCVCGYIHVLVCTYRVCVCVCLFIHEYMALCNTCIS